MSIRIKIDKISYIDKINNCEEISYQSSETLKINLPRATQTKNNNLSDLNKNIPTPINQHINKGEISHNYSDENTIRDILERDAEYNEGNGNLRINLDIIIEKSLSNGKIQSRSEKKDSSFNKYFQTDKRIEEISLIINKRKGQSDLFKHDNFVFNNYIEKEKFIEEQRRENNDLIMNKGFINENSILSALKNDTSLIRNSNSSISEDKNNRINEISLKLEKMTHYNKNFESSSTISISSYI